MSRDLISSLFWFAVAIYFSIEGFIHLTVGTLSQPGPGFFPFLGGVVLGLLSLIQLLKSLKNRDSLSLSGLKSSKFLLATGATLAYLLLLEKIGFVTITFLFLFLLFRLEYKRLGDQRRLCSGRGGFLVRALQTLAENSASRRPFWFLSMEIFHGLLYGFQVVLQPTNLLYGFIGVFIGTLVGVLPGLGPPAAIALLLPSTFGVTPVSAIIMLAGIYYGAMYGGSTTSILLECSR